MERNGLVRQVIYEMLGSDNIPPHSHGGTWESIKFPPGYEKPPKEEFEAKPQALVDAQPLLKLREERNVLLNKTDKDTTPEHPHADEGGKQAMLE